MSSPVPTVTLNNGVDIPVLGYGAFQIAPGETEQAMRHALDAGYRNLDTAAAYRSEEAVGRAGMASGIAREDVFITTKLWRQTQTFFGRAGDHAVLSPHGIQHESWGPLAQGRNGLFTHLVLTEIGRGYGKTPAQVVLRWLTQRDVVVILKTVSPERMRQNFELVDFALTDDDLKRIDSMYTGRSAFVDHRDPAVVHRLGNVCVPD